jgi:hypothetical protein
MRHSAGDDLGLETLTKEENEASSSFDREQRAGTEEDAALALRDSPVRP